MRQSEIFGTAAWVGAGKYASRSEEKPDANGTPYFPILRSRFQLKGTKRAILRVLGLGFFHCYINGKEITQDAFLPLSTDYEPRENYPTNEKLTGHRIYVPEYDVTDLLHDGENVLVLHFGGGWYTFPDAWYGDAKAIYRLCAETETGNIEILSSENDRIGDSFLKTYHFTRFEAHDYNGFDDAVYGESFDDSTWAKAQPAKPLDTEYEFTDCPADRVEEERIPVCLKEEEDGKCYDTGRNCSSIPVFRLHAAKGETVTVKFAEERTEDGAPHMNFHYGQQISFVSDGTDRVVQPMFTWFAYRYFKVYGNAEVVCVRVIHSDVKVTSTFDSDSETLNWIYHAYINTQLSNMHAGIPSDCPHIERRGYTGDGQLMCHTAMDVLDAEAFYRKWIQDISDCQDIYTGHVQYTAPYTRCGGGPGGWGCAIVEVPYRFYKHYGDMEPMKRLYSQMQRYLDFLDTYSYQDIVVSDKPGEWCLGDWCAPIQIVIPAGFVNNYFYIKSARQIAEIAKLIGRDCDLPMLEKKIDARVRATEAAYYNIFDRNYIGGMQGANAFALDLGLGDQTTYKNMVNYYQKIGHYDTGIFGTDLVTRILFEHGDGDLAVKLLMSDLPVSYEGMRRAGATTIWENWPTATWDRSRNHPMFGSVVSDFFDYLLGIRQEKDQAGYSDIIVAPFVAKALNRVSGSRMLPLGEVRVSYEKKDDSVEFIVVIPEKLHAVFSYGDIREELKAGENRFTAPLA